MLAAGHEPTKKYATAALDLVSTLAKTKVGSMPCTRPSAATPRAPFLRCVQVDDAGRAVESAAGQHGQGRSQDLQQAGVPQGRQSWASASTKPRAACCRTGWSSTGRQDQELPVRRALDLECLPAQREGRAGPYEACLLNNPIADPEKPLEVLRTVHSFDPCIACAIHLTAIPCWKTRPSACAP
jgi:hydrogenase large subunit